MRYKHSNTTFSAVHSFTNIYLHLLRPLCEMLEALGVWLYIITSSPGFDGFSQLTAIQLWVIHAYSSLPFTSMLQYFGRQSINMCCPDNLEEMDTSLEDCRPTSLYQRNLFLKSHQMTLTFLKRLFKDACQNLTSPQRKVILNYTTLMKYAFFFWFGTAKIMKIFLSTAWDFYMVHVDTVLSHIQLTVICYYVTQFNWFSYTTWEKIYAERHIPFVLK